MNSSVFQFADWEVDPATNTITRADVRRQMEPRVMDVLLALCRRANEVLSAEDLLRECWGHTIHDDNPVHKTVAQLRRVLGDNAKSPAYIETIRKRGYRAVGTVLYPGDHACAPMAGSWGGHSPFRGLAAFGEDDAPIFFGRGAATAKLYRAVQAQARGGRNLTIVLGPSGSGKTSLVQAGLLPALGRSPAQPGDFQSVGNCVFDLAETGAHGLLTALGGALLDLEAEGQLVFAGESGSSLGQRLHDDLASVLAAAGQVLSMHQQDVPRRFCLFVDRFEVLFAGTQVDAAERTRFLEVLEELAISGHLALVLACRNDFYQHLAACPMLMAGKEEGAHFDLGPPTPAEFAQIVRSPARAAGLSFGSDPDSGARLDDVLCASTAGNPDALPLLQHTLQELYRTCAPDNELRFDAYLRLGGLEGAIGQRAEEVVGALPAAQAQALGRILSLLVCVPGGDDAVTSRRAPAAALRDADERALVQALIDARLFLSELVDGEAGFGMAHDALLRRWPRVCTWIEEHRSALRVHSRIRAVAARWVEEAHSSDLLLPNGKQLEEACGLLGLASISLSAHEVALIEASRRRARTRARMRIAAIGMILLLAVLASALGVSAVAAKRQAQLRRADAEGMMGFMLGDFAAKLRPMGRLELLDSISAKAMAYLSGSASDELSSASMTQHAKALQIIAEVAVARAKPQEALAALEAARVLLDRQAHEGAPSWDLLKSLGANAFWQGQVYFNSGNWSAAEAAFRNYQSYSDRMVAVQPTRVEGWIEQSYAYTNLGLLALKRGHAGEATQAFERSIALKTKARAAQPNDRALAGELANSLSWLGSAEEALGALEQAYHTYGRELAIVGPLHEAAPTDGLWASRMASAWQRRGKLAQALGRSGAAEQDLSRAEQVLAPVVQREPGHRVWQASLAIVRLDRLRVGADGLTSAQRLAALAVLGQQAQQLLQLDPHKADWQRLQSLVDQTAGQLEWRQDRQRALQRLARTVERLETVLAANPGDVRTRSDLARTWLIESGFRADAGQQEAARDACGRALRALGDAAGAGNDYRTLDPWVRAQLCLGERSRAEPARMRLAQLGYRDPGYLALLQSHRP